eukprot:8110060-Alexandrium_andersonii.AAC.1
MAEANGDKALFLVGMENCKPTSTPGIGKGEMPGGVGVSGPDDAKVYQTLVSILMHVGHDRSDAQ